MNTFRAYYMETDMMWKTGLPPLFDSMHIPGKKGIGGIVKIMSMKEGFKAVVFGKCGRGIFHLK